MYTDLNKNLTPEQVALKTQVHKFAEEVLRPASVELDKPADPHDVIRRDSLMWDVFRKAYEAGYHIRGFPPELGGAGMGPLEGHIVAEEMGWGSADFAISLGVTSTPFIYAAASRNPELFRDVVQPFLQDREARYVGCWAITEPQHGSDTLMVDTEFWRNPDIHCGVVARLDGDEWVINGQKSAWVSNGTIATHALMYLTIEPAQGMAGGGVAIVPLENAGVTKGPPLNKLGQRALNQGEIFLDDVRIPRHYMLVQSESYSMAVHRILAGANAYMGAVFTGVARAAFELALDYSKHRVQGGVPISRHQLVQKKLFDMFTKVEAARQLSRSVMLYNAGQAVPGTQYSIASKVFCTQTAFEVAHEAVQVFGGYGLTKEFVIEKIFRDARASLIEDGSNDILSLTGAQILLEQY